MNTHNLKLEKAASKRRAMFLKLYLRGGTSIVELARKYKVSRQRMSWMILKATKEQTK
jgi:hypothetical protein